MNSDDRTGLSFKDFLKAFWADWFVRMSGPATVPLALAAPFVAGRFYKILLALLAIGCGLFSSYWVWRVAQIEIKRLKVKPYDQEQLKLVLGRINALGSDERDVLRYFVQFGEREQVKIFGESGLSEAEFGPIFTRAVKTELVNRDERQRLGRAGTELYWRINPAFTAVLQDILFPRQERTEKRVFRS